MPDALETAAKLDAEFAKTGKLVGPLHGVVIAIKDQYDTFDMRTTSGADAAYANDRPPHDATFITRLREAGAIILAKANMGEYAAGLPQLVRRHHRQSLRHHARAGRFERRLGDRRHDQHGDRRNCGGVGPIRSARRRSTRTSSAFHRRRNW